MIFQNQHIPAGVAMGLRAPNEVILPGERAFMMASTRKALTEGETPVHIKHFSSDKNKKEGSK